MKKIATLFARNHADKLVRNEVVREAAWVLSGEGTATRKYDGSACMVQDGVLYKRYDAKSGKQTPPGAIPADAPDPITGHWPHWVQVGTGPEDKWFREAWKNLGFTPPDGTYEAIGPHFQGNLEHEECDTLIRHGVMEMVGCPRSFGGIREYLEKADVEGIVFHHPDGRMAKVKKKDFGLKR